MPGKISHSLLRIVLTIFLALAIPMLVCSPSLSAEEPDAKTEATPRAKTQSKPPAQTQSAEKSSKTKLEPRDLLPSLLSPKPGSGSSLDVESLATREGVQMRRIERSSARLNRKMRGLDRTIRQMQYNLNRAQRIRRQRY